MPRSPDDAGQASTEYVAILAVVVLLLAGGVAAASPAVGEKVVAAVRTGICIVGGDVCRPADAAAAGLAPCLTVERWQRQDTTLDVAVVRLGGHGEWQLAVRSDGGATVTRLEENEGGLTAGAGVTFSPLRVEAEIEGALTLGYRGGQAWRFASAREAATFLARAERDADWREARPPAVRWRAVTAGADGEAAAAFRDLARAGLRIGSDAAIGLRTEGMRRTLTLEAAQRDLTLFGDLPGVRRTAGSGRSAVAELTWDGGVLRELAIRAATGDAKRIDEFVARLALDDEADLAVAQALLRPGGAGLDALAAHVAREGVLQHATYAVTERRSGLSVSARLGVALGLGHERVTGERRLVDATTVVRGGPPQRRVDCLGP
jgi:hypothetical protein